MNMEQGENRQTKRALSEPARLSLIVEGTTLVSMKLRLQFCLTALIASSPAVYAAEVMYDEPALATIWVLGILGGVAGLLALRVRWWLLIVTLPLPFLFFLEMLAEVSSPEFGPAIRAEEGNIYVVSVYVGSVLVLVGHILGFLWGMRLRRASGNHAS